MQHLSSPRRSAATRDSRLASTSEETPNGECLSATPTAELHGPPSSFVRRPEGVHPQQVGGRRIHAGALTCHYAAGCPALRGSRKAPQETSNRDMTVNQRSKVPQPMSAVDDPLIELVDRS